MKLFERARLGIIWGQIGKIIEIVLGLIFTVAVGRAMEPAGYGVYSLVISVVGFFMLVASLGFAEILGKFAPQIIETAGVEKLRVFFKGLLKKRLVLVLIIAGIVLLIGKNFPLFSQSRNYARYLFFIAALVVLQGVSELYISLFTALLKLKVVTYVKLLVQFLVLTLTLLFFYLYGVSVTTVLLFTASATFVGIIFYYIIAGRFFGKSCAGSYFVPGAYRFGMVVWLTNLANFALANHIDKILIGTLLKDTAAVGHYSIAAMLLTSLHAVLTAGMGLTVLPVLSEAYAKHGKEGMVEAIRVYFKLLVVVMLPAVFFLGYAAHPIIVGLFGNAYAPSARLLGTYVMLDILIILFMGGLTLFPLYILGKERLVLKLCIFAGALNIVLDLLLIPPYKALGAIIATGISTSLFSFLELWYVIKYLPKAYPLRFSLKVILSAGICLVPFLLWIRLPFVYLPGLAIVYAAIVLTLLYFLKVIEPEDQKILEKLYPRLGFLSRFKKGTN